MDLASLSKKLKTFIKKYQYAIIVLVVGLCLMVLPGKDAPKETEQIQTMTIKDISLNEQIAEILSTVEGTGKVQVLLTVRTGEEILYQMDTGSSENTDSTATQVTTVMMKTSEKEETGLIRQVNPPAYLGAIIVCQGGDRAEVRLAVVDAVSKVTGLGADRISVLKMK